MKQMDANVIEQEGKQRAVLVGVEIDEDISYSMKELAQLAEAAGVEVAGELIQKRERRDTATYIGKGKVEELSIACESLDAGIVIFNDELSGIQLRNVEDRIDRKVIDRTILILDIFASRAVSREGKLQVELAQLQYRMPRIIGIGKSLSRTGGGIGTRGPGEKKLETDRRHIERRITDIKRDLEEIRKVRQTQRVRREKSDIPVVALVGYTNSGKSTIMNKILQDVNREEKSVYAEDMLFATLDTFQRNIKLDTKGEFILIDTVGFVSKLPHTLVNAFKATLEEVLYADLLIHVVDVSYENFDFQMQVTEKVLKEIKAWDKKKLIVFNKIDKIEYDDGIIPAGDEMLYISARTGEGMDKLIEKIKEIIFHDMKEAALLIPYDRGDISSYLCQNTKVKVLDYTEKGIYVETELKVSDYNRYEKYMVSESER